MIPIAAHSWQTKRRHPAAALMVALMLLAAVLIQGLLIPVDADVSWLITVCERLLQGDRLYVDIVEANPPASVWLYLPIVWAATRAGMHPEAMVIGFAMVCALLSLWATITLAARLDGGRSSAWLAGAAAFVLLILPGGLFAQREHFAVMLAFPALATIGLLGMRREVGPATLALAGAAAGLMIVIKPPFAFPLLLASAWAASRARNLRPFLVPALCAVAVSELYALALLTQAPEYLRILPMLKATYLPMHDRPINFLLGPMLVFPAALYLLGRMLKVKRPPELATLLFLGSLGFALAGVVQGKNYLNHSYPGIALAAAAFFVMLGQPARTRGRARAIPVAGAALLMVLQLHTTFSVQPPPALADAIRRTHSSAPTLMTLGTELATGHPATRMAGARWVGSRPSLFTAAGARFVGLSDPEARKWYREDIASFGRDVATRQPDLILVEDRSRAWLLKEPAIRTAMAAYTPAQRAGTIEVWRRR